MADAPAAEKTEKEAPAPTLEERLNASIDKLEKPEEKEKPAAKPEAKADDDADDEKKEKDAKSEKKAATKSEELEDDAADDEEKPGAETKADEKKEAEDDDEEEDEEEDDDEITPEFKAALSKQRLDFKSLEGLNKKEQAVVLEHATRLNRAFTRAQMEATAFRKEKATFETERTYQTKNPDRFIADLLAKEPELLDKVNKELERRQNPIYAEALEKDRAADRKMAEAAVSEADSKAEELQDDIASLEATTSRAAREAGLPEEFAQEAVANAILQRRVQGKDHRLTDAEIEEIIDERTAIFNKHVGAHKAASTREAKNKYVKEKAEDAKSTKPNKPKGASTERKAVPAGVKPENVADFTDKWLQAQGM
jgi:hypothetical protein